MSPELAARLAVYQIQLLSEAKEYSIVARDACFAMLYRADDPAPGIGSSGLMTENGLAYLVWREGEAYLVGKGNEVTATAQQVEAIRSFAEDLKTAIKATDEHR